LPSVYAVTYWLINHIFFSKNIIYKTKFDNLNSQATELVIDGSAKAWAYADTAGSGDGDYGSSSQTIVVKVRI
jgi:hypothetical protein